MSFVNTIKKMIPKPTKYNMDKRNPRNYIIIRQGESIIEYALNDLTDAVNNMMNGGWIPIGSPNIKRDSTKRQMFIAFQAMRRENENNNSRN